MGKLVRDDWPRRGGIAIFTKTAPVPSRSSVIFAAIHRAIRADASRLTERLRTLGLGDRYQGRRLLDAFTHIAALMEYHHRSEDDSIFPFVAARVPPFASSIELLEGDHVDLKSAGARVAEGLRLVSAEGSPERWPSRRSRLVEEGDRFAAMLWAHLDREEDEVSSVLEYRFSPEEDYGLRAAMIGGGDTRIVSMIVPWAIRNTDAKQHPQLGNVIPKRFLVVNGLVWQRRFARRVGALYEP